MSVKLSRSDKKSLDIYWQAHTAVWREINHEYLAGRITNWQRYLLLRPLYRLCGPANQCAHICVKVRKRLLKLAGKI